MASLIGQDTARSEFDPGLADPPTTFGVWGDSGNRQGNGVVGSSSDPGTPSELGGAGVYGLNNARGGLGVRGQADHQTGVAVLGTSAEGTGVTGSSSTGVGVTAESTGAAALRARRPTSGGAVIEARLATPERAAEFTGDVQTSGAVTIGANLASKGFAISSTSGRLALSDATVGAERLTIDPTGTVELPTGLRTSILQVSGDAVVGAGGDGSLTLRRINGKSAKDDTPDDLHLNADTGRAVRVGGAKRASLQVSGDAVVGAGGDGSLTLRRINGKSAKDDTPDDLHLNWDTGRAVHIGRTAKRASLQVSGDAVVGAGGDGTLMVCRIKGKSAKDDTPDDLHLNADTGQPVHIGGDAKRASLQVHGNAVVGAGGDGTLTVCRIKGKSAKDDTPDDLHLNADTGQPVHIGGDAKRASLQVHGNAVVGAGGDGTLTVCRIKGKSAKDDTPDDLHLNADTGQPVHIGGDAKRASLQVHGNAVVGAGGDGTLTVPNGSVGVGTTAPTHPLHVSGVGGVRQNELYLSGGSKWSSLSYNAHHNDQNNNWLFPDPTRPAVTVEMDDNNNTPRFQVWSTTTGNKTGWQLRLAVNGETGAVTVPSGSVGVGTTAPTHPLHVSGVRGVRQNELYLSGGSKWSSLSYNAHHNDQNNNWLFPDPTRPAVTVEMDDNNNTPRFQVWSTTTGNKTGWQLRLAVNGETGAVTVPNGKVGIRTVAPRFELDVNGTACATQYCNPSDLRLKHDIAPVSDVLARLAAIRAVSFRSVSDQDQSAPRQVGVIAQEVEPGFPELVVSMAPYGFKAVDYSGLVGVVVAAVNELSARNANLSDRLAIVERFHRQACGSGAGDVA